MSTNRIPLRTHQPPPAGGRSSLRRPAQTVVWLLFAAVAITGLLSSGSLGSSAPAQTTVSVSAATDKGGASTDLVQPANLASPELSKYGIGQDGKGNTVVLNPDAPLELLPAYRWRDDVNLASDLGWRDIPSSVGSGIGGGLFLLAGFLWSALLLVMRFGLTTDLVTTAASSINEGFAGLAKSIGTSGVLAVVAVMVLVSAIGAFFRANLPKALVIIVMFAVPVGALQVLSTTASHAGPPLAYSPAGLAMTGSNTINTVGEKLATGFNTTNKLASGARTGQYSGNANAANCDYYTARLYATYAAASTAGGKSGLEGSLWAKKGGDLTAEEMKGQLTANSGLATVSYLWEKAFLSNWQTAQFGSVEEGQLMACHRLELNNNTPANEQFLIAAGNSTQTGPARESDTIQSGPYQGFTRGPFLPTAEEKDGGQVAMYLWAACADNHGAKARAGWKDVSGDATMQVKDGGADAVCQGWRTSLAPPKDAKSAYEWVMGKIGLSGLTDGPGGKGKRPLDFADPGALARATTASGNAGAEQVQSLQHVEQSVRGYWGLNPGQRAVSGLIALVTSGFYLWALGAMAVGAIVAQVGLVVMLVAFPVTLLLLALPGEGKRGRHPAGLRMLRLTGGFMAAKLVLIFSMTLLIQLIALLEDLVGSSNPIISAMLPIGALFGLRAILKSIGLGDITKLGGALAMSGAGGALMAGDKKTAGMIQRGVDPKRQAQNLRDWSNNTLAGRTTQRLAKFGTRAAVGAIGKTKDAGGRLGDFAAAERERRKQNVLEQAAAGNPAAQRNLERMNAAQKRRDALTGAAGELFGYRDPVTGERISGNALQRLGSLAALTSGLSEDNVLRRFAMSNKATADRARVLKEQHELARGLHAARSGQVDPNRRRELAADFWAGQLLGTAKAVTGSDVDITAPGALGKLRMGAANEDFNKAQLALSAGCDPDMIISSAIGAPMLVATTHAKGRVIPKLSTEEGTIEHAKSGLNYLPKELTERRLGESDEHYHSRLVVTMRATGCMDANGNLSDTLTAHGVDTSTVEGRAEVLKASRGESSRLDDIKIEVSADMRKQIEDGIRSLGIPFQSESRSAEQVKTRTAHASELARQTADVYAESVSSVGQMRGALSQLSSGNQSQAQHAIDEIVRQASQYADQAVPQMHEYLTEMRGLAALNANPGNESAALKDIARQLDEAQDRATAQARRIHELSGRAKLAPGPQAADAAKALVEEVESILRDLDTAYTAADQSVKESAQRAYSSLEQARSRQHQKQLRGASFAGAASPVS